jgi:predicted amidohydrolase
MTFDLIIRGGTVVDGLGGRPFIGDVAVADGVVAAVGIVDGDGAREIERRVCSSRPASSTCTPITTARRSGRTA